MSLQVDTHGGLEDGRVGIIRRTLALWFIGAAQRLMRTKFHISLCALMLALSTSVLAQTLSAKLQWTTTDSVSAAQSFAYTFKVGTTVVPIGAVTCAASGGVTTCAAPLTTPLAPGSYTLTATNAFGSATSDPLIGAGPGKPTITIVVTVTAE